MTPLAWAFADRLAVEGDVHRGGAAGDLAVVVDRLAALRGEELLDRRGGAVVERGLDDDRRAGGDAGLRLCLLLERVVEGVVDRSRDAGLLEGRLQVGASNCTQRTDDFVSGSSTQTWTLAAFFFGARRGARHDERGNCRSQARRAQDRRPAENLLHDGLLRCVSDGLARRVRPRRERSRESLTPQAQVFRDCQVEDIRAARSDELGSP